jgi:hypothetical protein
MQVLRNDARPPIPDGLSPRLRELIIRCWDRNPAARPSFAEIAEEFRSEAIFLPGAQADVVRVRVDANLANAAVAAPVLDDAERVRYIIDALEGETLPQQLMQPSWKGVEEAMNAPVADRIKAAFLFLRTSQRDRALAFLQRIPAGKIPVKLARTLVDAIAEDSTPAFLRSVVLAACKNGAADWAIIRCPKGEHALRKLAFEVVAVHGADVGLQAAVCDVCVQCLSSADPVMLCAALRCLVGIDGVGRLANGDIVRLLQNPDERVRACGVAAATKIALEGREMGPEIVELALGLGDGERAQALVVAMARAQAVGFALANRIADEGGFEAELALRILLAAAAREENRAAVRAALARIDLSAVEGEWGEEIEKLREVVGA